MKSGFTISSFADIAELQDITHETIEKILDILVELQRRITALEEELKHNSNKNQQ